MSGGDPMAISTAWTRCVCRAAAVAGRAIRRSRGQLASLARGVEYLVRTQNADGSWTELETTGTGFPRVYYLKYDIYRNAWPLLALATYRNLLNANVPDQGKVNGASVDLPETDSLPTQR